MLKDGNTNLPSYHAPNPGHELANQYVVRLQQDACAFPMPQIMLLRHSMRSEGTQVYRADADVLVDVYVASAVADGECVTYEQQNVHAALRVSVTDVPANIVVRVYGESNCVLSALPLKFNDVVRISTTHTCAHVAWCVKAHLPRARPPPCVAD